MILAKLKYFGAGRRYINFKMNEFYFRNYEVNYKTSQKGFKNKRKFWKVLFTGAGVLTFGCGVLTFGCGVLYFRSNECKRRLVRVTFGGVRRFMRSSRIAISISTDYYVSVWGLREGEPDYDEAIAEAHTRAAKKILDGCLLNGGLYVKLGQGLVVMDHILPKQYIETMRLLQDKCLERKPDEVKQLFIEDFCKSVDEIFEYFDEVPFAAASLAQVFKAKTKDGDLVAVKAQYIDLRDRFIGDVTTIKILLNIAAWLHPQFDFAWVLNELRETLEKELNFLNEAKNSELCAKDLSHMDYIYIPKVYWNMSSSRVLTTEYIEGIKISDKDKLKSSSYSLADIDNKLFKAFAEQIFHTGFVHADPHAGNILIRRNKDKAAQLVILDHGLYEIVPNEIREPLKNLWKSIVLNDHENMKKYANELGIADYLLFAEMLTQMPLKSRYFLTSFRLTENDMRALTDFARKHFDCIMEILRTLPKNMLLVFRNINTIRSIAKDHGDPIDRYKVMARCAMQGSFKTSSKSFFAKLWGWKSRAYFEISLWWGCFKMWAFNVFVSTFNVIAADVGDFASL